MASAFNFDKRILNNKDKLTGIDFNVKVGKEGEYKAYIKKIDKTSLEIVIFVRYENMVKDRHLEDIGIRVKGIPLEKKVRRIISPKSKTEFDLKMETKVKKPELFKKTINAKIENVKYEFRISGAGDYAVKLSLYLPFKDINKFDNPKKHPLENKIKNIVYYITTDRKKTWDMNTFQIMQLLN